MQPHPIHRILALRSWSRAGALAITVALAGWSCAARPDAETAPPPPEAGAASASTSEEDAAAPPPSYGGAFEHAVAEVYAQAEQVEEEGDLERAERELEMLAAAGEGAQLKEPPAVEPPDGEWLVDDEGREYFVTEIAKIEGGYRRLDDGRVRLKHGFIVDPAGETEDTFQIRVYKPEPVEPPPSNRPTPEEIAAAEASYEVSLPTRHTLAFAEFDRGLPRSAQWRNGFDVADVDGDGNLDIVHGPPRKGFSSPFIFLGDGEGAWSQWEGLSMPIAPYDYGDAEAADFDGDGHMDLAFAVHLGGVIAMRGDGEGRFERWSEGLALTPSNQPDQDTFTSRTIVSADWDGDGLPDLIALSEGPRHPKATERQAVTSPNGLAIFRNNGDGTWTSLGRLGEEAGLFGDTLAVGDFDGDGRVDLVTGTNALGRRELLFLNREGTAIEPVEIEAIPPSSIVWAVEAADFDGDGRDDLAVAATGYEAGEWWGSFQVLLNRPADDGSLAFAAVPLAGGRDTAAERVTAVGAGDLDGDGDADLVAATATGDVWVFLGDGAGGFVREEASPVEKPAGCRGFHVRLADLDSDDGDELIIGFAGESCQTAGSLRVWKATAK